MNKVLFPSNEPVDFGAAGVKIGWTPISAPNTLRTVADKLYSSYDEENSSIPSILSHIEKFCWELYSGNDITVNEWRGMLAIIALRRVYGFNVTVKEIPLFPDAETGIPTTLASIFGEALCEKSSLTGYEYDINGEPKNKTLVVFFKDGIPFAMFMPNMVICPFKSYPEDIFSDVPWYDSDVNRWTSVIDVVCDGQRYAHRLTSLEEKFYWWLNNLSNACYSRYVHTFMDDLLRDRRVSDNCSSSMRPVLDESITSNFLWLELKTVVPLIDDFSAE